MSLTAQVGTVKPAIDRPLSQRTEDWITDICWRLQKIPDRPRTTLEDIANSLRKEFKLGIPLMPQLHKLLANLGVGLESREKADGLDASFDYKSLKGQGRWEIYAPSDLGLRESSVIMHEVFEIVFWRCYHRIPWWAEWATEEGIIDPHKKADEFAFFCTLPATKFINKAKALDYDLWQLSGQCQANPFSCFNAISRFAFFPFPFFHILMSVGAQADQAKLMFDEDTVPTKVLRRRYKKPPADDCGIDWENLSRVEFQQWEAVGAFQNLPSKNNCFELRNDDLIYQAKLQSQAFSATTDRTAGIILDAPVDVVVNPNPDQPSLVYLQVMPAGCAKLLHKTSTAVL
jgi:hypothetical protein